MELRDYQKKLLEDIRASQVDRLCVQAATGFGKTVVFTTLAKEYKGRVLILVDSVELVNQTAKHFKDASTFEAKNKIFPDSRIVVSMVQTLKSRLKNQPYLIDDFDLIIIDECHVITYEAILEIVNCKIIGFTATPTHNRKITHYFCSDHKAMDEDCCNSEKIEFIKDFRLGDLFDDIVVGIPIHELIEKGFLVKEENYVIPLNDEAFELDANGEVTWKSAEEMFDAKYQMDVLGNYRAYCEGKKTMIFTQNTALNKALYEQFISEGVEDVFMYDSVNDTDMNRQEVVEKFRNTPASILLNVGCFTKGFDVTDVEAIIVARRISSLSLWIQIVGRGSRTTSKIYKDKFIVIDGGTNIERFGKWSDNFDWEKLFQSSEDYKPKKEPPEDEPLECINCGEFMPPRTCICEECGHNNCELKAAQIVEKLGVRIDIVKPDGNKIVNYCEKINKDKFFAFNLLTKQILAMFNSVDKEQYIRNQNKGVPRVMREYLKPNYIKIIRSKLPSRSNRTYDTLENNLLKKLNKKYGIQ